MLEQLPWSVFAPNSDRLTSLGYESVSGCSVLFHSDRGYERIPNRYLRERSTGRWTPEFEGGPSAASGHRHAESSSKGTADKLSNFLNYAEAFRLDIENLTYHDVLDYQNGMAQGRWSCSGKRLKPSTCNQRADEATFYLMWLADRGYRKRFEVDTKRVRFFGPGRNRGQSFLSRRGRLPIGEHTLAVLELPQKGQVLTWLSVLQRRRGTAKMFACRHVTETGARLFETCAVCVEQWPSASAISSARRTGRGYVTMVLQVAKGGKPRTIQLTVEFAALVREWIDKVRNRLVPSHLVSRGPLFVSDSPGHEGTPLSRSTIYRCFKLRTPGGPEIWYPHHGRHYFACNYVLEGLARDAEIAGRTLPSMSPDWVTNRASFWLNTLRLQLGHISETTTELYLRWLVTTYQLVGVARGWASFLDGEEAFT